MTHDDPGAEHASRRSRSTPVGSSSCHGTTTTRRACSDRTSAIWASSPVMRWRSSGSFDPAAARLALITHANGSMRARRRSAWSCAASVTGVASARVTSSTFVSSGFARRMSGVSIRPVCSALYARTIWEW